MHEDYAHLTDWHYISAPRTEGSMRLCVRKFGMKSFEKDSNSELLEKRREKRGMRGVIGQYFLTIF
jgi:hypothetical protein